MSLPSSSYGSAVKHPSLHRHSYQDSTVLGKKMSTSSLSNYVDIDRLIDDIKIAPQNGPQLQPHLANITASLAHLKAFTSISDEVRTIQLLVESISKKLAAETMAQTRLRHTQSVHQQQRENSARKQLSPSQTDAASHIVYANYSLKDIVNAQMETPIKMYDRSQQEESQVDKLNGEILVLEQMLKAKGVTSQLKNASLMTLKQKTDQKTSKSDLKNLQTPQAARRIYPTSTSKPNKENGGPKKYCLLQKTQEISLARPKVTPQQQRRREHNYR